MKNKTLFLLSLLVFNTYSAFAQLGIGSVVGIGQADMKAPGLGAVDPKIAFTVGASSCYRFNPLFGLGLDVVGTSKGGVFNGSEKAGFPSQTYNFKETYTLVDLEVPLIARLYLGNDNLSFNALAGAGMNFNIFAASSRVYSDANRNDNYGYTGQSLSGINPTNLSYTYGLGITAKARENYYYVNVRSNGPLTSLGTINGQEAQHHSFSLTFGYLFY